MDQTLFDILSELRLLSENFSLTLGIIVGLIVSLIFIVVFKEVK